MQANTDVSLCESEVLVELRGKLLPFAKTSLREYMNSTTAMSIIVLNIIHKDEIP